MYRAYNYIRQSVENIRTHVHVYAIQLRLYKAYIEAAMKQQNNDVRRVI